MIAGVTPIINSAHPACAMAKLTRSRRPAADSRAASNTPLTAAELDATIAGAARMATSVAVPIAGFVAVAIALSTCRAVDTYGLSAMQHDDICLGRGVDPRTPFRVRCALARVPTTSARNESQNAGSTHDSCAQCVELQTDRTGISYLRILLAYYLCRGPL